MNCAEALAAAFFICGHEDWAHQVLEKFSYGEPFLDINSQLLKRYAACADEDEIKEAEETWLAKIEREYSQNRAEAEGANNGDMWAQGNMNRLPRPDSDSGGSENEGGSEEESEGGVPTQKDPFDLSEDEDDEEMAELRRKVLASKPYSNPAKEDDKALPEKIEAPTTMPSDSDAESGSEIEDDSAFDNIINATPVTDRTGIQAKERLKDRSDELASATFSRSIVNAPRRW